MLIRGMALSIVQIWYTLIKWITYLKWKANMESARTEREWMYSAGESPASKWWREYAIAKTTIWTAWLRSSKDRCTTLTVLKYTQMKFSTLSCKGLTGSYRIMADWLLFWVLCSCKIIPSAMKCHCFPASSQNPCRSVSHWSPRTWSKRT